ncbi:hypothetical protein SCHPADRAFT_884919 [Schizopora paradoxa]|uniref:Uncharacterized protein n=1 Tax=Schizopora paradoxa TaxID=27342 RepID=A0A0H2SEM8_9AGAM|nr:hypothetical protein SCHPADRAFT_884919 [Schizopora paradoxa]
MPLLGFFKRDRSKSSGASSLNTSRTSIVSRDDDADHADADYVLPPIDEIFPTLTNGNASQASFASASSSRIKLPFRNKLANGSSTPLSMSFDSKTSIDFSTTRSSIDVSSINSTVTPRSRPSMSSVFPSMHEVSTPPSSTRSVPASQTQRRPEPIPLQKEQSASASKASGGFFSWARERKKSKPSKPKGEEMVPDAPLPPLSADSFHLMSFRHVVPEPSPSPSSRSVAQSSSVQSPPNSFVSPTPRPRGGSMASDTSQRISVAAFREAQARRSSTNLNRESPSPSIRPISLADPSGSATDLRPPRPPRAARPAASPARNQRSQSTYSIAVSSSDDDQQSSEDEDSDSDDQSPSRSRSRLSRQRTITKQTYNRARSDLGHGSSKFASSNRGAHHQQTTSTQSEIGHGAPAPRVASPFRTGPPPSSFQKKASTATVGTRSHSVYKRERGSYSTSELTPSAAAARASVAAAANQRDSVATLRQSTVAGSDSSDSESSEESSDDDDAPLSTLVNPKRPGSALSHSSRGGAQQQRKPLIDLNSKYNPLTGKPINGAVNGTEGEKKSGHLRPLLISPTDINNRLSRLTAEAGLGNYRKSSASKSEDNLGRGSGTASPQPLVESPRSILDNSSPSTSSPSVQKTSPVDADTQTSRAMSPKKERKSSLPPTSPTSFMSATSASPTIPGHEAQNLDDDKPLRPIPIKERHEHHGGFRVVSRPRKSPSLGSPVLTSTSPTEPQRSSELSQQSTSSLSLASGSSKESPKPTTTKYPPRSSSFMVTSRPLSGGSSDLNISTQSQTSNSKSMNSPNGMSNSRTSPIQTTVQHTIAQAKRRESPASSTGGSSNGKAPLTPMDGSSDYFSPDVRGSGSSPSGSSIGGPPSAMKGGRGHVKRSSVTFQEPSNPSSVLERCRKTSLPSSKKDDDLSLEAVEARRKERRRGEAKAAIELGNVINGPGPKLSDDDDDDADEPESGTMGPRMSMFNQNMNPSMGMNMNFAGPQMNMNWQQQQRLQVPQAVPGMLSPQQFMIPPPQMGMAADPAFLAAHQQAMMIAKQAYQYAVAQQAMAAAADEWERGSNIGGYAPSAISGGSGMNFGMGGMSSMGMGGWPNGGSMFPSAPRSMYAGSDFGGPTSQAGWGTASVYGESFGPSLATSTPRRTRAQLGLGSGVAARDSVAFPSTFQRSESAGNISEKLGSASSRPARPPARPRTNTAPSKAPLPSQHRNSAAIREQLAPPVQSFGGGRKPPSSWKNSS